MLLIFSAEKWKKHRKIITPTFHFKILEDFIDVFDANTDILVDLLSKELDKDSINIYPYIGRCALDIISETAMGTSVNAQLNSESEYVISVNHLCRILAERAFSAVQQFDWMYVFTENYRTEMKSIKILHNYTKSVIKKRKEEYKNRLKNNEEPKKRRKAFLDMLLEANMEKKLMSDNDIRQEVDTFMFEGHDTTASSMSFLIYNIAKYKDIQEKIVEEQRRIFGDDRTRPATYQDLLEMRYLEMVIKENMRLFPPIPFYARQVNEDIYYDGWLLPKGLNIVLFAYGILRNPEYFDEPEKFVPERFLPEVQATRLPYSYIPFSAGPRNCIGMLLLYF